MVKHSHAYYRMRVLNPAGRAANDPNVFPDEVGGIYQVDVGAAGKGRVSTIVQVQIDGKSVLFRTLQADKGAKNHSQRQTTGVLITVNKGIGCQDAKWFQNIQNSLK